jgi:hypothetical protein
MKTHLGWIVDSYVKLRDLKSLYDLKLHRQNLMQVVSDRANMKSEFCLECEQDLAAIEAGLQTVCKNLVLHGHVDVFSESRITGWACYPSHDSVPLTLVIFFDGVVVGYVRADCFRQDLEEAGYGNGCHGFEFVPPMDIYKQSKIIEVCTQNDVVIGSLKR